MIMNVIPVGASPPPSSFYLANNNKIREAVLHLLQKKK